MVQMSSLVTDDFDLGRSQFFANVEDVDAELLADLPVASSPDGRADFASGKPGRRLIDGVQDGHLGSG
jgi:hypothetical protein